jgi:hypothetical protein
MNPTPDSNVTTDTLRALTNAPNLEEPLVSPDAFAPQPAQSSRPIWKLPLPRLALIGVTLVPVFALAGYFVVGSRSSEQSEEVQQSLQTETPDVVTEDVNEVEQLRQENASMKAESALDGQAQILAQQGNSANTDELSIEATEDSTIEATEPTVTTAPTSVRRPSPPPQRVVASSPPLRPPANRPSQVQVQDPIEQWHQLAKLGSYGALPQTIQAIAPPESLPVDVTSPRQSTPFIINAEPEVLMASTASVPIPIARVAPTSAIQSSVSVPETFTAESSPSVESEDTVDTSSPAILYEAEAAILNGQAQVQSLIAGTAASGELSTPVILDETTQGDRFTVTLQEPLIDNRGRIAIPDHSQVLITVDSVSENGMIQLSAVGVVWPESGGQRELMLPSGVIQVRGDAGEPLMAERFDDPGDEIAAMDATQVALGAVRRTAELYTRSDTRVQTSRDTTVVTEETPDPNVLAGALEGGTDVLLDILTQRNERAIAQLESRPPIWFLEAGTPVQIFVNQSMQLPN